MSENIEALLEGEKKVAYDSQNSYFVDDVDDYRFFGDTNFAPIVDTALGTQFIPRDTFKDVSIASVFSDADANRLYGVLRYTASSSDETILIANIIGTDVRLHGIKTGSVTVTLTVTDLFSNTVTSTFTADTGVIVWIIEEQLTDKIYEVSAAGTLISSFATTVVGGGVTNVASIDAQLSDKTLWISDLASNKVYNIDREGLSLSSFNPNDAPVSMVDPREIAWDPDGSLWLLRAASNQVKNVKNDGTVVHSSFSTTDFDGSATNTFGMCVDQGDSTLWFYDENTDKVYNVTRAGVLISSFNRSVFTSDVQELDGLGFSKIDDTLWISGYHTGNQIGYFYNIEKDGTLISSFLHTAFSANARIPVGIGVIG